MSGIKGGKRMYPRASGTYDECGTPSYAFWPLVTILPLGCTVWEPAPGEGLLARAMLDSGFSVVETSTDFFVTDAPPTADVLVTNPPYSIKYRWVERALSFGIPVALLMPVESLGTGALWKACGHVVPRMILVSPRINFKMPHKGWEGTAQFPTAWFCWGLGEGTEMVFQPKAERGCQG